jgi:hypothetical protein
MSLMLRFATNALDISLFHQAKALTGAAFGQDGIHQSGG